MMQFNDERIAIKFWERVQPEPMSGCWLWVGAQNTKGYGHTWINGVSLLAHRVSFLVENEIPIGLVLDHKCRVRCCVNPNHLRALTQKENVLLGAGTAAVNARKVTCKYGHLLRGDNLRVRPCGRRECVTCKRRTNRGTSA